MKTAMIRNIKRLLGSLFLVLACSASFGFKIDGFEYKILSEEDQTVEISKYDFYRLDSIIEIPAEITYNDKIYTIKEIGEKAFYVFLTPFTRQLVEITMPSTITKINDYAFGYNENIKKIRLSSSLEDIGKYAFKNCISLEEIEFPEVLKIIGNYAFTHCQSLHSITFPSSLETIEEGAFSHCEGLEDITFSDGLKNIGMLTFSNCKSLTEVNVPNTITRYGSLIFSGCSSLREINLPENLESIPAGLVDGCTSLRSIKIPSTVKMIGADAFMFSGLTSIELPETVESIDHLAFAYTNLKSFQIPESLEKLGWSVFEACNELSTFIVGETNPNFSTESGILYNKDKTILVAWPSANGFVEIPNGIKEIYAGAFAGNVLIEYVELPETLTAIGDFAFLESYQIKVVYSKPLTPPEVGLNALFFEGHPDFKLYSTKIYVPSESLELYRSAPGWYGFGEKIQPIEDAGIDDLTAAPETDSYIVYAIDGRFMMQTRNIEDLRNLSKGLYIVNGKKHLVK